METEQQAYEVPGQQLRWRAAQLQQQGYPFQVQPAGGGIYIVIVQQPPGLDPFAYQPPPRPRFRQAWSAWDGARVLQWLVVLAVVAMLLGAAYMATGAAGDGGTATLQKAWDWLGGLRLPWEHLPSGEPVVETTEFRWPWESKIVSSPQAGGGFQWPWDAAMQSVQGTVTVVSGSILAVLVLLIVLALARRRGR